MRGFARHRFKGFVASLIFAATCAAGQPFITPRSVLNAASFAPQGLPAGAIAKGGIFSIFGKNLGPAAPIQLAFPLGTTLNGVSIRVTKGNTGVDAIPIYVSPTQINAILPSNAPTGQVSLQVTVNSTKSNFVPMQVADIAPGLFTATGFGAGPGIFQNFVSSTEQPINTSSVTAKPGQIVTLWGTGLGPITAPDNLAPPVGNLSTPIQVFVGGQAVSKIYYSGRAPCCSGLDQVVFDVPTNAPTGCYVPVQLVAGTAVSNTVTIAIQNDGAACSDPANPLSTAMSQGKKTGLVLLSRAEYNTDINRTTNQKLTGDYGSAFLQQTNGVPFAYDPVLTLPPAGSCTAGMTAGDLLGGAYLTRGSRTALSAGSVSVTGSRNVTLGATPWLGFAGEIRGVPARALLFDSGNAVVQAPGGANVGAFNVSVSLPPALTWVNRDALNTIDRSSGVTLQFTGAGARDVVVGAIGVDLPTNSSAMFLCSVPAGATSFTVPSTVLANFPRSRSNPNLATGVLFLGVLSQAQPFTATGLDAAAGVAANFVSKAVTFR